jgi:16S rRNA (guanine527-N7)-methyltransferase
VGRTAARDLLLAEYTVSRETVSRIEIFIAELRKWNQTVNLVSPLDIDRLWDRHVIDCVAAWRFVSSANRILDIGSGAGFPGIIFAIMAQSDKKNAELTLVEANQRKAAFLRVVCSQLELNVRVMPSRVENMGAESADIVSSRAFASIASTLSLLRRSLITTKKICLMKGNKVNGELTAASKIWHMTYQIYAPYGSRKGYILEIADDFRIL